VWFGLILRIDPLMLGLKSAEPTPNGECSEQSASARAEWQRMAINTVLSTGGRLTLRTNHVRLVSMPMAPACTHYDPTSWNPASSQSARSDTESVGGKECEVCFEECDTQPDTTTIIVQEQRVRRYRGA
jgi:hypothetical protein